MVEQAQVLELAGRRVPLGVRREAVVVSPHTGRELREIHGWISTADGETHRWLRGVLEAAGDTLVRTFSGSGNGMPVKWQMSWNSYAEAGGQHTYALILREHEELSIDALIVEGLELHPYEYREEIIDQGLTVRAKLAGSPEDVMRLRTLVKSAESVSVVRRGIHPEPREMRFGIAEWSEYEDGIKYRLVLVDRVLDDSRRSELVRIEEENHRAALAFYANFVERLAELLVSSGAVSQEQVEAAREEARTEEGLRRHEFWRVPDVDLL